MKPAFDFISREDKPALIAFSTPAWMETAKAALEELGYKVHTAATQSDFLIRFNQARYQVVLLEELFGANIPDENIALKTLQQMSGSQRRHATVILIGNAFQTFAPMEAFKQSVHAVINSSELFMLSQLVEKAVNDNLAFYQTFHDAENRVLTSETRDRL